MIIVKDENIRPKKWSIKNDDLALLMIALVHYNIKYYIFTNTEQIISILEHYNIDYLVENNEINTYL